MKRFFLFAGFVSATLLSTAGAHALPPVQDKDPVPMGCLTTSIDPDSPCYNTAGYPGCVKPKDYDTCTAYCACGYKYNAEKCNQSASCLDLAASERHACEGNCIADYT